MEPRFTDWNAAALQWCITTHSTIAPPAHPVSLGLWLPHTRTHSSKCWVTHHAWQFVAYSHSSAAGELNQSWGPSKVHDYEIWKISYCKCRKDKLILLGFSQELPVCICFCCKQHYKPAATNLGRRRLTVTLEALPTCPVPVASVFVPPSSGLQTCNSLSN